MPENRIDLPSGYRPMNEHVREGVYEFDIEVDRPDLFQALFSVPLFSGFPCADCHHAISDHGEYGGFERPSWKNGPCSTLVPRQRRSRRASFTSCKCEGWRE